MTRLVAFLHVNTQDDVMKLYYVLDPMSSWCWGFRAAFEQLRSRLPETIALRYVMGGLAPDSDEPMPAKTRAYVQSQWRAVTQQTGDTFNWDFWTRCKPRRSTYPACRAVIAAGLQSATFIPDMIYAIQFAYYQQAKNPSDVTTLVELAAETGLDPEQFAQDIASTTVATRLAEDFALRDRLQVNSFPSLRLQTDDVIMAIDIDYHNADNMLMQIENSIH